MELPIEISPDVWKFSDTCNVYVLKRGAEAISVDFGSGRWLSALSSIGVNRLRDVFLTHHHAEQCAGLAQLPQRDFTVHAPVGEAALLDPATVRATRRKRREAECFMFPLSYDPMPDGIAGLVFDMAPNTEHRIFDCCLRFVATPGHGPGALSIIVEFKRLQLGFCGDAFHAGAAIWKPCNLEWDHWTGSGALAAWEGVCRLQGIGLDRLCPSHGSVVTRDIAPQLRQLNRKLLAFHRAKGPICAGEKDHLLLPEPIGNGVHRIRPHLYQGPMNAYLVRSDNGADLIVDPTDKDVAAFESCFDRGRDAFRPEVALVTHAHFDHYSGIPHLQQRYGLQACLHPRVAQAITSPRFRNGLFRGLYPLRIDRLLPENAVWRWHDYAFAVCPWPGQTWWHAAHRTHIDGQHILFGGDSFQPASRWNGTGGFCAANLSRFSEGFIPSARQVLEWKPDILANGHRNLYRFTASRFRRILRWAVKAEHAVRDLCPNGNLERDYFADFLR